MGKRTVGLGQQTSGPPLCRLLAESPGACREASLRSVICEVDVVGLT